MTKDAFLEKFEKVILQFSEYENGTVIYMKELLNGDIILKKIVYGDDIRSISFHRDEVKRLTDIEAYPCEVNYLPHGNPDGNLDFYL